MPLSQRMTNMFNNLGNILKVGQAPMKRFTLIFLKLHKIDCYFKISQHETSMLAS